MIRIMCVLIITAIDTCNEFLFWISGVLPVWLFFFLDTCKIRIKKTLSSVTKFFVTKNHVSAWMEKGKNIIDIKNSRKLMLFQPQVFLMKLFWWFVVLTEVMLFPGLMQTKWRRIRSPSQSIWMPPAPTYCLRRTLKQREKSCLGCGTDWQ